MAVFGVQWNLILAASLVALIPMVIYLATFIPIYGLSPTGILEAQRRIFGFIRALSELPKLWSTCRLAPVKGTPFFGE